MITIRAEAGKYFFSNFINLSNGKEASLDETLLTFRQLETLHKAIKNKLIVLSPDDLSLVQASLLQKGATEEKDLCCGTPNAPIVEYTEESPLPPYDHPLLVMKESKNNKVKTIVTGNDIHYPTTGAVIKYVNNAVCHLLQKDDLYKYALKSELAYTVSKTDLSKYATLSYVDAKVVATETNLSGYYKSTEVDTLLTHKVDKEDGKTLTSHDFTSDYKDKLDTLDDLVLSSLDGYSTTTEMDNAISTAILEAQLEGANVDLSNYYTSSVVDDKLSGKADKSDLLGLASETYVITALSNFCAAPPVELSEYAKKTEVESLVNGLATEEFVSDAIASINIPSVDLSQHVTKSELSSELTAYKTSTQIEEMFEEVPKLEVVSNTVAPVLTDSVPLYTLGENGDYVLCTPDKWIDLGNGLVIPAYNKQTLGLS